MWDEQQSCGCGWNQEKISRVFSAKQLVFLLISTLFCSFWSPNQTVDWQHLKARALLLRQQYKGMKAFPFVTYLRLEKHFYNSKDLPNAYYLTFCAEVYQLQQPSPTSGPQTGTSPWVTCSG